MSQSKAQLLDPQGDLTLPGLLIGVGATFSGNVSIGGTLTKQDVTNVDSVGVITARSGVNISGGNLQVGGTNVINSSRALYNLDSIKLADGKELKLGSSDDLKIYHNGSHSYISEVGNGALKVMGDDIRFVSAGGTERLTVKAPNGQVLINQNSANDGAVMLGVKNPSSTDTVVDVVCGNNSAGSHIAFSDDTYARGLISYNHANNFLAFRTNGVTTDRLHITSDGYLLAGHTNRDANIASGTAGRMQLWGTSWANAGLALVNTQAASDPAFLSFAKSRKAAAGDAAVVVQNGDRLGEMRFAGDDGTDMHSYGASIAVYVDGTPGSNDMPGKIVFATTADGDASSTTRLEINAAGSVIASNDIQDSKGDIRSIPKLIKSSNHTLVASDAGCAVFVNAAANVTVNDGVLTLGDAVTIVNHHTADITIIQDSGMTMYNSNNASTGNRTLASRGMATIWFAADDTAYISGSGLS